LPKDRHIQSFTYNNWVPCAVCRLGRPCSFSHPTETKQKGGTQKTTEERRWSRRFINFIAANQKQMTSLLFLRASGRKEETIENNSNGFALALSLSSCITHWVPPVPAAAAPTPHPAITCPPRRRQGACTHYIWPSMMFLCRRRRPYISPTIDVYKCFKSLGQE
jgi:hypothetical protein